MQLTISTQDQQIILSTPLKTTQIEASDELQEALQSFCDAYQDSPASLITNKVRVPC